MNLRPIAFAALAALFCGGNVSASDNPFFGSWKVASSIQAPWYDGNGALPTVDPELEGKTITFAKDRASGSRVVACAKPIYTLSTVEPESLFEGGLKNPAKEAAALGFKSNKIVSMNEGCDSSAGDMELDFPMVNNSTILLGINNCIYTLKRVAQ